MVVYQSRSGTKYDQLHKLGGGGEGDVFALASPHSDKVLKIYHPKNRPSDQDKIQKLSAMSAFKPRDTTFFNQVAWIRDIIYDKSEISAIVLQKAIGKELNPIMEDKALTWDKRLEIAKNFCGLLHFIHSENQVIGDFNDNNFLVDLNKYALRMVDVDSMHFKDGNGKIYRCGVAMPDIIAPELVGVKLSDAPLPTFTPQTDLWALAIHIFRLLMYNYHPFSASTVKGAPSQVVSQNRRVKNGQTPFFKQEKLMTIPKEAAEVDWVFPGSTINLFKQTFLSGHSVPSKRVGAKEWFDELKNLSNNLKKCTRNPAQHIYHNSKTECPWCKVDRKVAQNSSRIIKTIRPTRTTTNTTTRPQPTMPQQSQQLKADELFTGSKLRVWLTRAGIVSSIVGAVYSLGMTGSIGLGDLLTYSMRFFFPYLLIGGIRWGRDQLISTREGHRTYLINVAFVMAVILMRIAATVSYNGSATFDYHWDSLAWVFLAWFLGTGVSRLITLGISKIPNNPNSSPLTTFMDSVSLLSMLVGTLAAGTDYMVASTGKASWDGYYIESLPDWLRFLEDLFSIKVFSIEQSSTFFGLGILVTLVLIFLPELSAKMPKNLKTTLSVGSLIFGYLLASSYFAAVLSIGYLIGTMIVIMIFTLFIIGIFAS